MKASLLTLLAICLAAFANAQAPNVEWAKAMGGTGNDRANSIEVDAEGNIIVVGRFQSPTIIVDGVTLTKNTVDNADVADIFIIKLDPTGKALWGVAAGGEGDDHAMSCVTDAKGNVYVVGWFECQTLTFGKVSLAKKTGKGSDMYVAKFSPAGECLWACNAGGEGDNGNYSTIALDKKNNVMLAGNAGVVMDFGKGIKLTTEKGGMYFAKYSNEGNLLWAKGASGGECHGFGVDGKGNMIAGGFFNEKTAFDDIELTSNGKLDAYIVKYSPKGKVLWAKNFGGDDSELASCATDPLGNHYLSGMFFSATLPMGTDTLKNNGSMNHFIAKFDAKGNLRWARSAGGNNGDGPSTATREFHADENGFVYCTGSNWAEFVFAGQPMKPVAASEDVFLLTYDAEGNEQWGVEYGGAGRNAGRGVTTDGNHNIYLTGSFEEQAMKVGDHTLTNVGDSDIFVVKYSGTQR